MLIAPCATAVTLTRARRDRTQSAGAWDDEALDLCERAYADPDRLRAGFAYYSAFARSAERNRELAERGPLEMPVLAVGGRHSLGTKVARDLATVVTSVQEFVAECGYFVSEEAPQALAPVLDAFQVTLGSRAAGREIRP